MKNRFRLISCILFVLFFFSLYAVPSPFMDPRSEDLYSPSAQSLGMGGSFSNIWAHDPQGMWENPAAVSFFAHQNKIGIGTGNMEWLNRFGSGTIAGGFSLSEKLTLGVGMTTVNWNSIPDFSSMTLLYGGLSTALSYHSLINASIGISAKNLFLHYPDTTISRNTAMDIGAIVEWPILASLGKGDVYINDRNIHLDFTPGIHFTFKNLGPNVRNDYLFGLNINLSATDLDAGTELIHVKYAHDIKESESINALELGLYDIVFLRYGNHNYGSTNFISSGYGINYTRLIMNLVHAFGIDKNRSSIINQLAVEQHWGTWTYDGQDVGVSGTTFLLKWHDK